MRKLLTLIALAIGLVLGPVQLVYCLGLSGSDVDNIDVSFGKAMRVELDSSMNPIRLTSVSSFRSSRSMTDRRSVFHATISGPDEQTIHDGEFVVTDSAEKRNSRRGGGGISINVGKTPESSSTPIHAFDVAVNGPHTIRIDKSDKQQVRIDSMSLNVRRNVRLVHVPTAVIGVVLTVLSVFGGILSLILGRRTSRGSNDVGYMDPSGGLDN